MKGTIFIVMVLIVTFGYLLLKKDKAPEPVLENNVEDVIVEEEVFEETDNTSNTNTNTDNSSEASVKEFTVLGGNFSFSPKEIRVNKGDTVKITFTNNEGFHDFVIGEFNVKTKQIKAGESETIEFVADKAGEFMFICSVGDHVSKGMMGKIIVQ